MFKNKITDIPSQFGKLIDQVSLPISTTKIAITGLSRSGKTVFITSLIDQLLHQKKIKSITENNNSFTVKINAPNPSVKRFDYYSLKKVIKEFFQWPDGTGSITSTILEFEVKSSFKYLGSSKFRIELIDYPGEWILDIAMLNHSYEKWSHKVIEWMKTIDEEIVRDYLRTIEEVTDVNNKGVEQKLHDKYSKMLKFLKENNYSNLTPGRFLMPSDLLDDPMLCFAPLYETDSTLHENFKARYDLYLDEVVNDIQLEHFKGFDRQIVLIDVVEALQNGPQCYNDMKSGLKEMLSLYDHNNKNFISKWFSSSINKVLFIATKADLIAPSQHNNYSSLLEEMVEDIRKNLDIKHIETKEQIISSVSCTEEVIRKHDGKTLSCIKGISAQDKVEVVKYPGEMPSSFPAPKSWDTENYSYEEFLPTNKTYKENEPFKHINMDKVIDFIIGDLL